MIRCILLACPSGKLSWKITSPPWRFQLASGSVTFKPWLISILIIFQQANRGWLISKPFKMKFFVRLLAVNYLYANCIKTRSLTNYLKNPPVAPAFRKCFPILCVFHCNSNTARLWQQQIIQMDHFLWCQGFRLLSAFGFFSSFSFYFWNPTKLNPLFARNKQEEIYWIIFTHVLNPSSFL